MTYKRMLILAIIFAALAASGAYRYLNNLAAQANIRELPYTTVVIAKKDIPIKKVLDREDLELKQVLQGDNHPNAYKSLDNLIGKVTTTKITAGEQILATKLASKGDIEMGLGFIVSSNMRAITVAVSEVTGVGNMIKPGDHVDLLVRISKDMPDRTKKVAVSTLLQNVKVLAQGKDLGNAPIDEKSGDPKTVTLEVYPEDAQKVFLASEDARLLLTLRSPGEQTIKKIPYTQYEDLSPGFFNVNSSASQNTASNTVPIKTLTKRVRGR